MAQSNILLRMGSSLRTFCVLGFFFVHMALGQTTAPPVDPSRFLGIGVEFTTDDRGSMSVSCKYSAFRPLQFSGSLTANSWAPDTTLNCDLGSTFSATSTYFGCCNTGHTSEGCFATAAKGSTILYDDGDHNSVWHVDSSTRSLLICPTLTVL